MSSACSAGTGFTLPDLFQWYDSIGLCFIFANIVRGSPPHIWAVTVRSWDATVILLHPSCFYLPNVANFNN